PHLGLHSFPTRRSSDLMEELSHLQRRFVSDVSHELRTPLTTIRMAAEMIYESRDELDPAASRSAELLTAQLDRFEDLLADLLEIDRKSTRLNSSHVKIS